MPLCTQCLSSGSSVNNMSGGRGVSSDSSLSRVSGGGSVSSVNSIKCVKSVNSLLRGATYISDGILLSEGLVQMLQICNSVIGKLIFPAQFSNTVTGKLITVFFSRA